MNIFESNDAWQWRKDQYLSGLELSSALDRKIQSQVICPESSTSFGYSGWLCGAAAQVVETRVNATTGETISSQTISVCPPITDAWRAGNFSKTLDPLNCLTTYSNPFGNRSDLIIEADYDYLSGQETVVLNKSNALLFSKQLRIAMEFGFWNNYDWRCGTTNSFDCKSLRNQRALKVLMSSFRSTILTLERQA
jgi:hypothetical protein